MLGIRKMESKWSIRIVDYILKIKKTHCHEGEDWTSILKIKPKSICFSISALDQLICSKLMLLEFVTVMSKRMYAFCIAGVATVYLGLWYLNRSLH